MSRHAEIKTCPQCGAAFECLAHCGANTCWCMELPPLPLPADAAADCLCPKCLRAEIARAQAAGAVNPRHSPG